MSRTFNSFKYLKDSTGNSSIKLFKRLNDVKEFRILKNAFFLIVWIKFLSRFKAVNDFSPSKICGLWELGNSLMLFCDISTKFKFFKFCKLSGIIFSFVFLKFKFLRLSRPLNAFDLIVMSFSFNLRVNNFLHIAKASSLMTFSLFLDKSRRSSFSKCLREFDGTSFRRLLCRFKCFKLVCSTKLLSWMDVMSHPLNWMLLICRCENKFPLNSVIDELFTKRRSICLFWKYLPRASASCWKFTCWWVETNI